MRTAAQALADCLALGRDRATCDEGIASQMVGGVYCDGTIVQDASGRRCVPRDVIDRVRDARQASPLPSPVVVPATGEQPLPWGWFAVGGVVLAGVVLLLRSR